eukprot:8835174-Pyramimonas_sp.AAC.1
MHPGFHFHRSAVTALDAMGIPSSQQARVSCKPARPVDEGAAKFQDLAGGPPVCGARGCAASG